MSGPKTGPRRERYPLILGRPTSEAEILQLLASLAERGLIVRTPTGWAARTIQPPSQGIQITNGDGVDGDPTLALANDLAALENLTGVGYAKRIGNQKWALQPSIPAGDVSFQPQAANSFLGGPVAGSAAAPTFRPVVPGDLPQATETAKGAAEIATQAEVDAGTDNQRIVTPLTLEVKSPSRRLSLALMGG